MSRRGGTRPGPPPYHDRIHDRGDDAMKVPLKWLADYVELTVTPAQLVRRLTMAGLEVGGLRFFRLPGPEGVPLLAPAGAGGAAHPPGRTGTGVGPRQGVHRPHRQRRAAPQRRSAQAAAR